uniref:Uncharacterized protein n=1 Tax=Euplotes harpa TaxID=151035 RepID=A0A7S3N8E6_9SPIT|mmetsp:Transcript_23319/g.26731  ORF Transcript_23319/g.26731 Transcript_23319/m.26731 type:complete len:183 (+) Transcript_23319:30-578(+)
MADLERASVLSDAHEIKSISHAEKVLDRVLSKHGDREKFLDELSHHSNRRTKSVSNYSRRSVNMNKDLNTLGHKDRSIQDSLNKLREKKLRENGSTIAKEVQQVHKMNSSLKSKLRSSKFQNTEDYDSFFKNGALMKLPPVQRPVVCLVDAGRITFVAANDAHSKESNFGFSRNKFGGFYNH